MNEIDKRLEELDNGAKAKEATLTYWIDTGSKGQASPSCCIASGGGLPTTCGACFTASSATVVGLVQ